MNRLARRIALPAAMLAVAGLAAACSSENSTEAASTPAAPAQQQQALPPVMVEPAATTATAKVGDAVVFNVEDPENTTATSDNPAVLEVTGGYNDGSAVFNPGGQAKSAGTATVTLTSPAGSRTVVVTVLMG